MSLYIGASRKLIGTRAPIYRRVACNELSTVLQLCTPVSLTRNWIHSFFKSRRIFKIVAIV